MTSNRSSMNNNSDDAEGLVTRFGFGGMLSYN